MERIDRREVIKLILEKGDDFWCEEDDSGYTNAERLFGEILCMLNDVGKDLILTGVKFYVNVYEVGRSYGGPEEGGWYYDYGDKKMSFPVESKEDAEVLKKALEKEFPDKGYRYSASPKGSDYQVRIQSFKGEDWPWEQPRYS